MRLKKFLELIKESKDIDNSVLQKLEIYLADSIGNSVRTLGLTATDMQQICTDLDIETVEEFFSGKEEDLFYGQDEEDYYDYDDGYIEEDEEDLSGVAALAHKMLEESGIEKFYVSNKGNNISIQFVLEKTERFSKLTKIRCASNCPVLASFISLYVSGLNLIDKSFSVNSLS